MLAKKIDLAFNKGNSGQYRLKLLNQENEVIVLENGAMIYFTVKENPNTDEYVFQKRLGDGIAYSEENQCYFIDIQTDDTEPMEYKDYFYDIAIVRNNGLGSANQKDKITPIIGNFKICYVATFECNEVIE